VILVTTAGKVGAEAAKLLREQDVPVRVLARDPERPAAKELAAAGAEIIAGDLAVPASIDAAMTGVSAVVINGVQGPLLAVRQTSADGFQFGVEIESPAPAGLAANGASQALWVVTETMATNTGGGSAVSAPTGVLEQFNVST